MNERELDIKKMLKADLDAELELYKKAGINSAVEPKNNKEKAELVGSLRSVHGIPMFVDEKFLEANPTVNDVPVELDSIVFVPVPVDPTPGPTDPDPTSSNPEAGKSTSVAPTGTSPAPKQLLYRKKHVIRIADKVVNGKSYKEVHVEGETALLTPEECAKEVTEAKSNE